MTKNEKTGKINKNDVGLFKKVRATVCKHCPACTQARKNPESIIGRILHHPSHSKNCPMWKAYEELFGEDKIT